jgi:hypothetical protein
MAIDHGRCICRRSDQPRRQAPPPEFPEVINLASQPIRGRRHEFPEAVNLHRSQEIACSFRVLKHTRETFDRRNAWTRLEPAVSVLSCISAKSPILASSVVEPCYLLPIPSSLQATVLAHAVSEIALEPTALRQITSHKLCRDWARARRWALRPER